MNISPRVYFFALILIFVSGCATTSSEKRNLSDIHLRMGTSHLQNGSYPQALQELLTAVELDPSNPIIHNNLALAYYVREKYEDAERHLKKALELAPKYSDARNNLGRVYIAMKMYDPAILELAQVASDLTYPTPEKAQANLSLAHYKKGDFPKARDAALLALKTDKSFCPAQNLYGLSLFFLEDYKKSAQSLERTVNSCDKEKEEAHYYMALSYFKLGARDKASARLKEIIGLYPEGEYAEKAKNMLSIINR